MSSKKRAKPIPVRLTEDIIQRLDNAVDTTGMSNRSDIIKLCIASFLDYLDKKGKASLPLDWQDILKDLDGRTHRYKSNGQSRTKKKTATK